MSEYTPLTPQEIYEKDIATAGEEGLTPTTRIEWFLNKILVALTPTDEGGSDDTQPDEGGSDDTQPDEGGSDNSETPAGE